MSTIAAYRDTKGVIGIVCDSMVTTAGFKMPSSSPKLIDAGALCYGFAGIYPPVMRRKNYAATLTGVQSLANDLYAALLKKNHGGLDDQAIFCMPVTAIVIGPGIGPMLIGSCGEVIEAAEGYLATGSGGPAAMGAMFLAKQLEMEVEDALTAALNAAETLDPYTGGQGILRMFPPVETPKRKTRAK